MSTGESKAAEQARLRRERREKKILAQGSSRLEKIAGLQGGATAREALHPEPPHHPSSTGPVADPPEPDIADISGSATSSSLRSSEISQRHAHSPNRSPGLNLFGVDGGDEDPFNMLRGGNDLFANLPEELKNDPMMKLLLNSPLMGGAMGQGAGGMGGGGNFLGNSENSSSDDLNNLAEKITKQFLGARAGMGQSGQDQVVRPDTSAWKWKFARIISVLTVLGFLWGQLEDYHFSREFDISYGIPIFYTFIVVSLSLQALRLILDQGKPLPGSMVATIGSFLPHPFGTILVGIARYRMILTDLLEDFAALVFGLGMMYWVKTF